MLHGRTREREAIDAAIGRARVSNGNVLVIRGESGVGKTALLRDAATRHADLLVLRATGAPIETTMPFAHLHQLLRPLSDRIDLLPSAQALALRGALGSAEADEPDMFAVALATLDLLSDAATVERPVLAIVDDAQWLDRETWDVLGFVGRRIEQEPITIVISVTGDVHTAPVPFPTPSITIEALDRLACDAVAADRTGRVPAPQVRAALWALTRGNALTLVETLDTLSEEQLDGAEPLPEQPAPGSGLHRALMSRLDAMSTSTATLLLVAAAEERGDLDCVLRTSAVLGAGADALAPAERAGIVTVADGRLAFCHPVMRTSIYQAAPFGRRQEVHRAIAEQLPDADSDQRAWHLAAAVVGRDDAVAAELDAVAARSRRRGGHAAASLAFERASTLTTRAEPAGRRMVDAANEAWLAGQGERCRELMADATRLVEDSPLLRADLAGLSAALESTTGDRRAAFQGLVIAADALGDLDASRTARLLVDAGHIAWSDSDLAGLTDVTRRLRNLHLPADDLSRFRIDVMLGLGAVLAGDDDIGHGYLRSAIAAADRGDPQELHIAGTAAIFLGDDRDAFELLARSIALSRSNGLLGRLPHTLSNLATLEMWSGSLASARALATEGAAIAHETGQRHHGAACSAILAWLAAVQGRGDECKAAADLALTSTSPYQVRRPSALATWAQALASLGTGRWTDALTPLEMLADERSARYHPTIAVLSAGDLIETAQRTERHDVAAAALDQLEAFAMRSNVAWAGAIASRCRALLADTAEADDHFAVALERHAAGSRPFDEARTRLSYGEHLRRAKRKTDARTQLRLAIATFAQLEAEPWEQRAAAELRATGESVSRRDASSLTRLTPQQRQIVDLVNQGASNKEVAAQLFLSPRTVDYHLRNVFTTLGITSRAELARLRDR